MAPPRSGRVALLIAAALPWPLAAALAEPPVPPVAPSASASAAPAPATRGSTAPLAATSASAAPPRAEPPPPSPEVMVTPSRAPPAPGLHPAVSLRDDRGELVLRTGRPLSSLATCGGCHDAAWIAEHGYHFRLGVDELVEPGRARSGRAWDRGPGLFGRWDPLAGYDSVAPSGAAPGAPGLVDAWVTQNAARMLGAGPARRGDRARRFEADCVVCHVRGARVPDVAALGGDLASYSSAALLPLGVVRAAGSAVPAADEVPVSEAPLPPLRWLAAALQPDGTLAGERLRIRSPASEACGACHGIASRDGPTLGRLGASARATETTGAVFSPARISSSELNVAGRAALDRPWDVHAERLLECSDCHFSPNDPASAFSRRMPAHLRHDARHVSLGEFLRRPSHELAKGYSTQGTVADAHDGTMRRCEDCHDPLRVHAWLPRTERHLAQIACETCHVSALYAPARQVTDYSVPDAAGRPRVERRGLAGSIADPAARVEGYQPLLLRRDEPGGRRRLVPYNMVASFFWVVDTDAGPRPASLALLGRAFHVGPAAARLRGLLDRDGDGQLSDDERVLDTSDRVAGARELLVAAGAQNPRLEGELQPFGVHHGVGPATSALRDCAACHAARSRLVAPFTLAERAPFGVAPRLVGDARLLAAFSVARDESGRLTLAPRAAALDLHVLGLSRSGLLDALGLLLLGLTLGGAATHGALRVISGRRAGRGT